MSLLLTRFGLYLLYLLYFLSVRKTFWNSLNATCSFYIYLLSSILLSNWKHFLLTFQIVLKLCNSKVTLKEPPKFVHSCSCQLFFSVATITMAVLSKIALHFLKDKEKFAGHFKMSLKIVIIQMCML